MTLPATNWAGNVRFSAQHLHRPESLAELQRVVAGSRHARALGTGHSFCTIADTPGDLISVAGLPDVFEVDTAGARVRVGAGARYGELASRLDGAGLALRNLASLPHICVAGACATGTHGSGDANGSLATAVAAIDLVTAGGDVVSLSRGASGGSAERGGGEPLGDELGGAVVALGALGIVTTLTLDVVPTFQVVQRVYDGLPREHLIGHLDEVFASGYSVSAFTDWRTPGRCQVWVKRLTGGAAAGPRPEPGLLESLGARPAGGPRHPVPGRPAGSCTEQLGVPGPWHRRLPHFRPEFTPSAGDELQSEYLVDRALAGDALRAAAEVGDLVAPVLRVSEIRTVAADDLWLSMAYRRDCVAIHFTWVADERAVAGVLPALEHQLAPLHARPHWGKLFAAGPDVLGGLYPRLADFRRLASRYDPGGKFRNGFLDATILGPGAKTADRRL